MLDLVLVASYTGFGMNENTHLANVPQLSLSICVRT